MKKISFSIILAIFLMMFAGCSGIYSIGEESAYDVYYINLNETALVKESYVAESKDAEGLIDELLKIMESVPEEAEHFVLLNESVKVNDYQYDGSNIELHLSEGYGELPKGKEVLTRAGLVRTLVQIEGVDTVSFLIAGQPLCDSKGVEIGKLSAASFIENSGREINSYKSKTLTLYFTDETGARLLEERRTLYYSSNVSLEQVVVEQLIKGPKTEGNFATLPSAAKVMNVTVVDKICYVNVDDTFLNEALNIQEQIPIYSIVNSIIENCSINQVQISINGESDLIFRETMKLGEFYTMNRDLIQRDVL